MPSISVGSLGEYIREQREQAEVSLRQLARTAGVSNPYLSQVERGLKRPSAEILQQIAQGAADQCRDPVRPRRAARGA